MRACGMMLVGLALGCGGAAPTTAPAGAVHVLENTSMTATEAAPEPKSAAPKGPWTETVTVRHWDSFGKGQFLDSLPDPTPAYRKEKEDGSVVFFVKVLGPINSEPSKGSQIVDSKGTVYVVNRMDGGQSAMDIHPYVCYVTRKP